jgi:hypothetical protein
MAESLTVGRNGRADTPPENAARHFEKTFSALSRSPMQQAGLAGLIVTGECEMVHTRLGLIPYKLHA